MAREESFGALDQFPTEAEVLADARRRAVQARRSRNRQFVRRIPATLIAICRVICHAIVRVLLAVIVRGRVFAYAICRALFVVVVRGGTRCRALSRSFVTLTVRCGRFSRSVITTLWLHTARKVPWHVPLLRPRHSVLALTLVSFGSGLLVGSSIHLSDASRAEVEVAVAARPQFKTAIDTHAPVMTDSAITETVPVSTSLKIVAAASRVTARPVAPRPASVAVRSAPPPVDPPRKVADATAPASVRARPRTLGYRGSLVVNSRPSGARVFLNGRSAGQTPLVLKNQPAGSRAVRLSLDGYAPWTSVVQIVAGREVRLSTALTAETAP